MASPAGLAANEETSSSLKASSKAEPKSKRPQKWDAAALPYGTALVLDVKTASPEGKELARSLSDYLQARLSQLPGRTVMSSFEIQRLLDLESEKSAMGCEDDSCIADLAGSLDADAVVFSRLTRLGSQWGLRITFYDAKEAKATSRILVRAKKEERLLSRMEQHLSVALGETPARKKSVKLPWLTIAGTGSVAVGLAVGAVSGGAYLGWTLAKDGLSPAVKGQLNPIFPALPVVGGLTSAVFLVGGGTILAVDILSE
ncbi:MAG: hypothetical protein GY822_10225 [Deltaproteobacteria bacterium]|nr:hypothetical protein [Deltaproteobacteria bacterium]